MPFKFKAKIYKVGINPCVKVPLRISSQLKATKGYIPVKGKINDHPFQQTLVPVKNEGYRLYVNGPMMKGANVILGQTAGFIIEQDTLERNKNIPMPATLKKELEKNKLFTVFKELAPFRQKEICRYLNNLKTEDSLKRNVDRIINVLKGKASSPLFRLK